MSKIFRNKVQTLLQLGLLTVVVILVNILANARFGDKAMYGHIDLTEEKRFTLTSGSKQLLREVDDVVFVRVLLDGEFPSGFKRLQNATRDMLAKFRSENSLVEYEFEDPAAGTNDEVSDRRKQLAEDGIRPINLRLKDRQGTSERLIYPYAVFYYKGRNIVVNLLENEVPGVPPEVILNNAVELLEYKFANAIQKLRITAKPIIVFSTGNGELEPLETADLEKSLRPYYDTGRLNLDSMSSIPQEVAALVIAKPRYPFSEKSKFKLDQYVMNGGKVLWLIDALRIDMDSLRTRERYLATEYTLNLDDLLFQYGARLKTNLVLDYRSTGIQLVTGIVGNAPQFDYFKYPYHVVALPSVNHPIVKSLDGVNLQYVGAIDTIKTKTPVKKTVLLESSQRSMLQYSPVTMDFEFLRYDLDSSKFNKQNLPMALLLEGTFSSLYENRMEQDMLNMLQQIGKPYRAESLPTRMIVVADGDVAKNKINIEKQSYSPLGYNEVDRYLFANKGFVINSLEYLLDEQGVAEARGREVKLRMLDTVQAQEEKTKWRLINIALPLALLALFGWVFQWWRKRRWS
ncbi:MAG TPA: gliding motility-associated ABC transporter substrate-binding protein GldG [Saprospiraceae bacterium]|jgi:ABC-2 type transport system permease protein|nr:gliding motility-associated ABC transporter substrate-binding protein GldG [Saprospiraceae bacterium]